MIDSFFNNDGKAKIPGISNIGTATSLMKNNDKVKNTCNKSQKPNISIVNDAISTNLENNGSHNKNLFDLSLNNQAFNGKNDKINIKKAEEFDLLKMAQNIENTRNFKFNNQKTNNNNQSNILSDSSNKIVNIVNENNSLNQVNIPDTKTEVKKETNKMDDINKIESLDPENEEVLNQQIDYSAYEKKE